MGTESKLLINEPPLVFQPSLAALVGLHEAIVLQTVHYFMRISEQSDDHRKFREGRWWVYNSYPEWQQKHFDFLSERTVRRTLDHLVELGALLVGHFSENPIDRRNWYTIDYDRLDRIFQGDFGDSPDGDPDPETPPVVTIPEGEIGDSEDIADLANLDRSRVDPPSGQDGQMGLSNLAIPPGQNGPVLIKLKSPLEDSDSIPHGPAPEQALGDLPSGVPRQLSRSFVRTTSQTKLESSAQGAGIVYIPVGEEFKDKLKHPQWKEPTSDLCRSAFDACGREKFASKEQRHKWRVIEKSLQPLDPQGRVKYPLEWVERLIEWARETNEEHRRIHGTNVVKITFDRFLAAIDNEVRKKDWINWRLTQGLGQGKPEEYTLDGFYLEDDEGEVEGYTLDGIYTTTE